MYTRRFGSLLCALLRMMSYFDDTVYERYHTATHQRRNFLFPTPDIEKAAEAETRLLAASCLSSARVTTADTGRIFFF